MKSEPLYLKSMTVQNIRCFGDDSQTLDLTDQTGKPAKWNLILGDNGVGKTTLLQCFAYGWLYDDWMYNHANFHLDESGVMELDGSPFETFRIPDCWARSDCKSRFSLVLTGQSSTSKVQEFKFGFNGLQMIKQSIDLPEIAVCAYGPERRIEKAKGNTKKSSLGSLFDPHGSFLINTRTWLRDLDYAASKESDIQAELQEQLERVQQLLIDLLPDVSDIRITTPSQDDPSPDVEFETPYGWVELKNLAYGYQSLVSWVVDFAYRLIERNPDSSDPLAAPAICLIDELDLHLHPSWQRDVMSYLSNKFPNTQFIATVHSPLIVQAAASVDANVAVLRRVTGEPFDQVVIDNDPEIVRSWRLDQLLASDLFTTTRGPITPRAPTVQEKLDERRQILSKSKLTKKDKLRLGEIIEEIDIVPFSETSEHQKTQQLLAESYKLLAQEEESE